MPREKDPFRDYVEFLQNDKWKWKCIYCNIEYRGSVTRIKAHLAGVGGYGINDCKKVDPRVRSKALKAVKAKGPVEPSNGSDGDVEMGAHQPVTANNEDAWRETSFTAMPNLSSDAISTVGARSSAFLPLHETNLPNQPLLAQVTIPQQDFSFSTQPPQYHAGDSYIPSSGGDLAAEDLNNMLGPVNAEEGEPNAEVPQDARTDDALLDGRPRTCGLVHENMPNLKRKLEELSNREADMDELEAWCRKAERIKGEYWSMVRAFREGRSLASQQVERVDDFSKEVEDILGHCRKGSTSHAAGCRKSSPLVTTELVGEENEETIEEICEYLMEDEIFIIGICGMGGVGKTAILTHVHNRILENTAFNDVFWVTVPQEFNVYELQDEIANVVGLDNLSKDKDVKRRACLLNRHLKEKKRTVLLLDELWMHFEVEDVGIPIGKGGLKLALTTRSLDVCHKMLCQKHIKIEPLCYEDDYRRLFFKKLCPEEELPSEVEEIAESILDKCKGLPLGIIEMATHMRGVERVHEWKDLLQKLEESRMELDVLKKLKLSYKNLGSPQVQRCFLHLVLCFGEDIYCTTEEALIESFIDEGLLGRIATRKKQHDQGNTILDKIRKSCLLEYSNDQKVGKVYGNVHPLIRGMALQIVTSTTHMVKAYMGLKEIPEEEFWTDGLEKVFLQGNDIEEIPHGISPNCPKLTRLSLNGNVFLEAIHESFFEHLKELKVLDLSNTGLTELPDSISDLESLEALLLRECQELHGIPCVGKLGSLRKLDLSECPMLEEVPEGMEMLVKLTYLDLRGTGIETLPEGVLGKLLNLQHLAMKKLRAGEEIKLKKVEALYCSVPNVETFNACTRLLEQNSSQEYHLGLNASCWSSYGRQIKINSCASIEAREDGGNGGDGGALLLPKNVQELEVRGYGGVTRLCEAGALGDLEVLRIEEWENLGEVDGVSFPRLKEVNITGCPKLKRFLRLTTSLPNLEEIIIKRCEKLEEIIGGEPLSSGVTCGNLTYLEVNGCNNMKRLMLTQDMWFHLPFLEKMSVSNCKGIEVIVGAGANTTHASFPKLTDLTLGNLPELKSICDGDGTVSCDSLQRLDIWKCPKLKRIPVQLPLLDDGLLPSPPPSLWWIRIDRQTWESLEWDHPRASSSLQRLVVIH